MFKCTIQNIAFGGKSHCGASPTAICSRGALRMTRAYKTLMLILALPIPRTSTAFSKLPLQQRCLRPRMPRMSIARVLGSGTTARSYGCQQPLSRSLPRRRHSSLRLVTTSSTEAVEPAPSMQGMQKGEVQCMF